MEEEKEISQDEIEAVDESPIEEENEEESE